MSVWTPAHDENVAQASCLHERRLQARCLRYIFVVIFLRTGRYSQRVKRFLRNDTRQVLPSEPCRFPYCHSVRNFPRA
jgi:hypothetical protein